MPRPARLCPCGSGHPFLQCCAPLIEGGRPASTPQALMRSRYTAFCLQKSDYLLASWHSSTRPASLDLQDPPTAKWIGLTILKAPPPIDETGQVEFLARYRVEGRGHRLHERSHFVREGGRWYYVHGDILPP